MNERYVLNQPETKEVVEELGVVAIRANRPFAPDAIKALMKELGNEGGAIPFYAIYPGDASEKSVKTFDGLITKKFVITALREAGPSKEIDALDSAESTAMKISDSAR